MISNVTMINKTPSEAVCVMQGLQQHIHACHNLFDFHCLQSSLKSGIPTILSRCPPDLIDSHGNLCCLESQVSMHRLLC